VTCATCRKLTPKAKQWVAPSGERFCSGWCMDARAQGKTMIDPTPYEQTAMENAGEQAGQYLEALGKTDLATLTAEEWATFINVVCTGYIDSIQEQMGRLEANLDYLRKRHEPIPA
jgi:hypothetical protein